MKKLYFLFLLSSAIGFAQLTPPVELQVYYNDVDFNQTQLDLFNDLAMNVAAKHTNYISYTPGVWNASKITDEDPLNPSNVLLIYGYNDGDGNHVTDRTRSKNLNGGNSGTDWNREHTFPNGLGQPNLDSGGSNVPPYADAHNLRPSDVQMNSNRGSRKFAIGSGDAGTVGANWYPGDEWKGDAARILMYMYLRYGDQCKPSYASIGTTNAIDSDMINLLLDWNAEDPVSDIEKSRNSYHGDTSETYAQGNRNPFIDNPYIATVIWGGPEAENLWGSQGSGDMEPPTVPSNLMASNETATSVDLNWTASTDNVGVVTYNIYVDGQYNISTNSTATTITVNALTSETTYSFAVLAADLANNTSALSTPVSATTLEAGSGGNFCVTETFDNIPDNSSPPNSEYRDRSWTGDDGGQWSAKRARTDQILNSRAIAFDARDDKDGSVTSPSIDGGIGNLTITTLRLFSGGSGNLDVHVNGVLKGSVPYSDSPTTTTIDDINVEGTVSIVISENTNGGDRVAIDDLSWTCYSALGLNKFSDSNVEIYPNPASDVLQIKISNREKSIVSIYNILGKIIKTQTIFGSDQINVNDLSSGIYILKATQGTATISKKLIKQ